MNVLLHFVSVFAAGAASFVGVVALVERICSAGRSERIPSFILYPIGLGIPPYVSAAFHHGWLAAVVIHGLVIAVFFAFVAFQSLIEAYVIGMLAGVLLTLSITASKTNRASNSSPNQALQRTASASLSFGSLGVACAH